MSPAKRKANNSSSNKNSKKESRKRSNTRPVAPSSELEKKPKLKTTPNKKTTTPKNKNKNTTQQQAQPPSPPPSPPGALITLLRRNKTVLKYFTSLQKNLIYDVDKWKVRTKNALCIIKEKDDEIKQFNKKEQQHQTTIDNDRNVVGVRNNDKDEAVNDARTTMDDVVVHCEKNADVSSLCCDDDDEDDNEHNGGEYLMKHSDSKKMNSKMKHSNNKSFYEKSSEIVVPVCDDMFANEMYSSSSSSSSGGNSSKSLKKEKTFFSSKLKTHMQIQQQEDTNVNSKKNNVDTINGEEEEDGDNFLSDNISETSSYKEVGGKEDNRIMEAYTYLKVLGISVEVLDDDDNNGVNAEENNNDNQDLIGISQIDDKKKKYRCDLDILSDILHCIFILSRTNPLQPQLQLQNEETNNTSRKRMIVPCYHNPNHPSFLTIHILYHTFCILDLYNNADAQEQPHFNNITTLFVKSLQEEISWNWAYNDRKTRHAQNTLHILSVPTTVSCSAISSLIDNNDDYNQESISKITNLKNTSLHISIPTNVEKSLQSYLFSLLQRDFYKDIDTLWNTIHRYILSCLPCLYHEENYYPKYSPILSFCLIESMLIQLPIPNYNDTLEICQEILQGHHQTITTSNLLSTLHNNNTKNTYVKLSQYIQSPYLKHTLSFIFNYTATIYQQRLCQFKDNDNNTNAISSLHSIPITSKMELDAFYRLYFATSSDNNNEDDDDDSSTTTYAYDWLHENKYETILVSSDSNNNIDTIQEFIHDLLSSILQLHNNITATTTVITNNMIQSFHLILIIKGTIELLEHCLHVTWDHIITTTTTRSPYAFQILQTIIKAYQTIQSYTWEKYQVSYFDSKVVLLNILHQSSSLLPYNHFQTFMSTLQGEFEQRILSSNIESYDIDLFSFLIQYSVLLSNGELLFILAQLFLQFISINKTSSSHKSMNDSRKRMLLPLELLLQASEYPTIRVINLQKRPDRLWNIYEQAALSQIILVKGVIPLNTTNDKMIWGDFAIDGTTNNNNTKELKNKNNDTYVSTHWQPNNLKLFDEKARRNNDASPVLLSSSERACAMSHIACWKAVRNSLLYHDSMVDAEGNELLIPTIDEIPNVSSYLQLFQISGYAQGEPLSSNNHESQALPPTPVCLILEDDAILVDRFSERLASILNELPRDFHCCMIGYARPKNAPIIKYSAHLGLPTSTWYLTGYILSLEGVQCLLNHLPVVGPVDSWIGHTLTYTWNWKNKLGGDMNVGYITTPIIDSCPSQTKLNQVLQFKNFAALIPLCHQKVDGSGSWRDRDTDIIYSGQT